MGRSGNITPTHRWLVASATAAGTKHVRNNLPNQDHFHHLTDAADRLIIAVCDGAGSAPNGAAGSQTAAAAVESIQRQLDMQTAFSLTDIFSKAAVHARSTVINLAEECGLPRRDYATTMTLFVHNGGRSATAQIGDGACVLGTANEWFLAHEPKRGQHANETFFITQEHALQQLDVSPEMSNIERVMICTDGMMALTLQQPDNVPHCPYFDGTFSWLRSCNDPRKASRQMEMLLRSDRVSSIVDDDVTMVQQATLSNHEAPNAAHQVPLPPAKR